MNHRLRICLLMILGLALATSLTMPMRAQSKGEVFEDPEGKYSLTLPAGWHAVTSRDGLGRPQVDIIYNVRENGLLKIRRIAVEAGAKAMDVAKREEEQSLRFQPGYAKGSVENFAASVNAALVVYDFTSGGKPMIGRNYYLLVNETTIYLMRFSGSRNTLGPIRNQTDAIARSFKAQ
jgi:hypothetical protein